LLVYIPNCTVNIFLTFCLKALNSKLNEHSKSFALSQLNRQNNDMMMMMMTIRMMMMMMMMTIETNATRKEIKINHIGEKNNINNITIIKVKNG